MLDDVSHKVVVVVSDVGIAYLILGENVEELVETVFWILELRWHVVERVHLGYEVARIDFRTLEYEQLDQALKLDWINTHLNR